VVHQIRERQTVHRIRVHQIVLRTALEDPQTVLRTGLEVQQSEA